MAVQPCALPRNAARQAGLSPLAEIGAGLREKDQREHKGIQGALDGALHRKYIHRETRRYVAVSAVHKETMYKLDLKKCVDLCITSRLKFKLSSQATGLKDHPLTVLAGCTGMLAVGLPALTLPWKN